MTRERTARKTTILETGEVLHMHLAAGAAVVLDQGEVVQEEPPCWLANVPAGVLARLAAWGRHLSRIALRRLLAPIRRPASRR